MPFPTRCLGAISKGFAAAMLALASLVSAQTNSTTTLRKAAIDVFAGHTTARLLQQLANECASDRRDAHAAAFSTWERTYKLRGFDALFAQQVTAKEREQLDQQVQSQLAPKLKQMFPNCVSGQLNTLYTSASMNPGKGGRDASLAMVQAALAGSTPTTSTPAPLVVLPPIASTATSSTAKSASADLGALEGVYLNQSTGFGVGGMMTIEFDAYAVFKDGTITSDMSVLGGQSSAARDPKKWGRWQRVGNGFRVTWNSGKASDLSGSTFYKTFPASPGETL
ncbi:MAG: hypothetical protein ACRDAM_14080, partial [Casimicrobium sp.]